MFEDLDVLLVGPGFFRGPQPRLEHLHVLKARGLTTLVNLRAESDESRWYCEQAGVAYRQIPVADWTTPEERQVEEFLALMDSPEARPLYVHCYAGVGRTGVFVSCWRIAQGMEVEEAIRLSDLETPWCGMSQNQRDWLRAFERRRGPGRSNG